VIAGEALAEVAFAVADQWQNRCLGTRLAFLLAARARELGVDRFRANMLADNSRSVALMRRIGRVVSRQHDGPTVELEVALD
jgi:RimJ/RimL family protein N-acetyltransferase